MMEFECVTSVSNGNVMLEKQTAKTQYCQNDDMNQGRLSHSPLKRGKNQWQKPIRLFLTH